MRNITRRFCTAAAVAVLVVAGLSACGSVDVDHRRLDRHRRRRRTGHRARALPRPDPRRLAGRLKLLLQASSTS